MKKRKYFPRELTDSVRERIAPAEDDFLVLLHDIGRANDLKDDSHGEKSPAKIKTRPIEIKGLGTGLLHTACAKRMADAVCSIYRAHLARKLARQAERQ